ncbi:MAG: GNAT family N-acetyltransferase [Alphaproteobacteria bacterium]|nr:GNAT family N-acetyltransferase [Alphaproteobacteria bacterium]
MDTAILNRTNFDIQWRTYPLHHDVVQVIALVTATSVFSDEEIMIAGELVSEALERGCGDSGYFFQFAYNGDELAGYACYGHIALTRDAFDLYWIAVLPRYAGTGLAGELLERSEFHIKALGGKQIHAETSGLERYKPAQVFYQKQGYNLMATFPDFYKPGDAKLVYVKKDY